MHPSDSTATVVSALRAGGGVVHVDTERGFSGGEVQVLVLMDGLARLGIPQTLVAPPDSAIAAAARERGHAVGALGLRNPFDLLSAWRLARIARCAALLHLHTGKAAWLGGLAAWFAGAPAVVTRRMDRRVRAGWRTRFIYERVARGVVAISPAVVDCLVAGGVAADRITLIPDALDEARAVPVRGRAATRADLGVDGRNWVVLTAAQLVHRKGVDVLLRAFAAVRDAAVGRDAVLVVAGDGPEAVRLQALAASLGVAGAVRFLGNRTDIGDLLAACDCFVLASRAEGLGVAALEALGAGKPVVASRVGGLAQLIQHEVSGLLFAAEDHAGLAAALLRVAGDAALTARLTAGGAARLDDGFRAGAYVDKHLAVYGRALGG